MSINVPDVSINTPTTRVDVYAYKDDSNLAAIYFRTNNTTATFTEAEAHAIAKALDPATSAAELRREQQVDEQQAAAQAILTDLRRLVYDYPPRDQQLAKGLVRIQMALRNLVNGDIG